MLRFLSVIVFSISFFCSLERPAFAAGECDGSSQPITVSIPANGDIYLQEAKVTSYRELEERISAVFGHVDCLYIRIDPKTRWRSLEYVLVPLSVNGDLRIGSSRSPSTTDTGPRVVIWVRHGYDGKVTLLDDLL